jgi:hypothetical protein
VFCIANILAATPTPAYTGLAIRIRLFYVLMYILVPIGAFLFPAFIFTLLIYHRQAIKMGIVECILLVVPILFITLTKPKQDKKIGNIIRLCVLGLFLFAIVFAVLFTILLPVFLGAMG